MDIQLKKYELIEWITQINDFDVIAEMEKLRKRYKTREISKKTTKKQTQKEMLKKDLSESLSEIKQLQNGKKEKQTLEQFINEF